MAPTASTNGSVYKAWVVCSCTTSSATTIDDTWSDWNSTTAATTGTSDTSWGTWNESHFYAPQVVYTVPKRAIVTPEEARKQEVERNRLRAKREREEREADAKAEILLKQFLSEDQLADFYKHRRFRLKIGQREYEIDCTKRMHNVYEVVDDKLVKEHCIYAGFDVPLCDNALAQKMMLETNEDELHRIANQTDFHRPVESPLTRIAI